MIETALYGIQSKLDEMYSITVEMIELCMESYEETMQREKRVNELEIEIDELIVQTLALYQPEATHLRELLMDLKINNDIERIADHAENVARDMKVLKEKGVNLGDFNEDLKIIKEFAKKSFVEVYSSFKNRDAELALHIIKSDEVIDKFRDRILNKAVKTLETETALKVVSIAQNFERIADLSTNIAEDVIFITRGEIVKHGKYIQP
ncbi:MAG: PhoU domain-containing protein [candidate division WOR-3 bacterium]